MPIDSIESIFKSLHLSMFNIFRDGGFAEKTPATLFQLDLRRIRCSQYKISKDMTSRNCGLHQFVFSGEFINAINIFLGLETNTSETEDDNRVAGRIFMFVKSET